MAVEPAPQAPPPAPPPAPTSPGPTPRRGWSHGAPYGCLAAFIFAAMAGFVLLVGSIMGDCWEPGCKDGLWGQIARGMAVALVLAALFGFAVRTAIDLVWAPASRALGTTGAGVAAFAAAVVLALVAGWYGIWLLVAAMPAWIG